MGKSEKQNQRNAEKNSTIQSLQSEDFLPRKNHLNGNTKSYFSITPCNYPVHKKLQDKNCICMHVNNIHTHGIFTKKHIIKHIHKLDI